MARFPLYDPARPEDLPESLRVSYGLIGIALDVVGQPVEITPQQMEAIRQGLAPSFKINPTEDGGLILTPNNRNELPIDTSEFE